MGKRETKPTLLIFDADNTLWDTDTVFREAQLAMLRPFIECIGGASPEEELTTLRQVDRALFQRLGRYEYDFRLLADALAYRYLRECPLQAAADAALQQTTSALAAADHALAEQAYSGYARMLQRMPALLPDTYFVLSTLQQVRTRSAGLALALFSEGNPKRLERILAHHEFTGTALFQAIHIGPKSPESFERLQNLGNALLGLPAGIGFQTVVVGDSLSREIKYGNHIGATTVYIPAGFLGAECPAVPDEAPDYTLTRLGELPALLRDLHLI